MPSNQRALTHALLTFAVSLPGSHLSHLGAGAFSESCPECCTSHTIFSCGLNTPQSAFPVQNPPLKSRPQWQLPPWYLQPLSSATMVGSVCRGQRDPLTLVPYIWTCGGSLSSLPSHLDHHARSVMGGHRPAPAHSLPDMCALLPALPHYGSSRSSPPTPIPVLLSSPLHLGQEADFSR